jgi:hypothetical protein
MVPMKRFGQQAVLVLPLQQMRKQHAQPVDQLVLLGLAHVGQLLDQVLDVQLREAAGAQQLRRALRPRGVVAVAYEATPCRPRGRYAGLATTPAGVPPSRATGCRAKGIETVALLR